MQATNGSFTIDSEQAEANHFNNCFTKFACLT